MKKKQLIWLVLLPIALAILGTAAFLFFKLQSENQTYNFDYAAAVKSVSENEEVLYVAVNEDCPPFSYYNEAMEPYGYDVELALLLGKELGYNIRIRLVNRGELLTGLKIGTYQLAIGMTYSDALAEQFRYSLPACSDSYVFFGQKNGDYIQDVSKLYDKRIAVLSYSAAAEGSVLPLPEGWVACDTADAAFQVIESGGADLLLASRITGMQALETSHYPMEILSSEIAASSYYILTSPENTELGNAVDNALRTLGENGTLDRLSQHWLHRYLHESTLGQVFEDDWILLLCLLLFIIFIILLNLALYQRRQREATIAGLERDSMTGMLNRQAFCTYARQEVRRHPERSYVIGRMDLDHFKLYNEAFGSEAGDRLIAEMGRELLKKQEAMGVSLFGHISGDYFVMLTQREALDPQQDYHTIIEMMQALDPNYSFSVHMGYCPVENETMDISLACDRAMLAQRSIHNDYEHRWAWYDESMRRSLLEERDLSSEMRQALEAGQFVPWFQPQYDYSTGSIIGAEVLVRWQHPKKGLLQPGKFIPSFEKNGFVFELDKAVWRATCAAIRRWKMQGLQLPPISVNLSRRDIYHRNLHQVLLAIVREAGLTPADLRLEITESAYMENPEQLHATIKALTETGFFLEMDDFGSGYSSLTALKDMPFNLVKLDMAFLGGNNNDKSGSILSSVVHMAHLIDLPVIAEGIETKEQADYLKSLGCLYMQGYYFSAPLSEREFENLLRDGGRLEPLRDNRKKTRVDFLDPDGQEALLFNSFVGGAAILDYSEQRVSILRANDRFYAELCSTRQNRALEENLLSVLAEQNCGEFTAMLEQAIQSGREAECEAVYLPESGRKPQWIHNRVRCLSKKVNGYVLYLSAENVTGRREMEERLRLREAEYRAAAHMSTDMVCRYRRDDRALVVTEETAVAFDSVTYLPDAPEEFLRRGYIAEDSREKWLSLFQAIEAGQDSGSVNDIGIATLSSGEMYRYNAGFATIRSADGQISSAILSFRRILGRQDNAELELVQKAVAEKERELKRQLHGMTELTGAIRSGMWMLSFAVDGQMDTIQWGDGLRALLGFQNEQDFPNTMEAWLDRVHMDDRETVMGDFYALLKNPERSYQVRYRLLDKAGNWLWVYSTGRLEYRKDGSPSAFAGILLDITKEKSLEAALTEERTRYRDVLSALRLGTWYIEGDEMDTLYADEALCSLLGISPDTDPHTMLAYWKERIAPEDRAFAEQDAKAIRRGEMAERILRWNHPTQGYIYLRVGAYRDTRFKGLRISGCTQNIDRQVHEEQEALRAARQQLQDYKQADYDRRKDYLTGLYNRQDLYDRLQDGSDPVAAVFKLDIDDFRAYNAQYGCQAGDEVLQKLGAALTAYGEVNQITFYRYGGAQILGVSHDHNIPSMTLAREMVELVRNLNLLRNDAETGCITVSVGYTGDIRDPLTMPDKAEAALRRAQEAGRNRASA